MHLADSHDYIQDELARIKNCLEYVEVKIGFIQTEANAVLKRIRNNHPPQRKLNNIKKRTKRKKKRTLFLWKV